MTDQQKQEWREAIGRAHLRMHEAEVEAARLYEWLVEVEQERETAITNADGAAENAVRFQDRAEKAMARLADAQAALERIATGNVPVGDGRAMARVAQQALDALASSTPEEKQ